MLNRLLPITKIHHNIHIIKNFAINNDNTKYFKFNHGRLNSR
ncbi:hypothetical protein X975_07160, partial [Stegodyphus mimosarum]